MKCVPIGKQVTCEAIPAERALIVEAECWLFQKIKSKIVRRSRRERERDSTRLRLPFALQLLSRIGGLRRRRADASSVSFPMRLVYRLGNSDPTHH